MGYRKQWQYPLITGVELEASLVCSPLKENLGQMPNRFYSSSALASLIGMKNHKLVKLYKAWIVRSQSREMWMWTGLYWAGGGCPATEGIETDKQWRSFWEAREEPRQKGLGLVEPFSAESWTPVDPKWRLSHLHWQNSQHRCKKTHCQDRGFPRWKKMEPKELWCLSSLTNWAKEEILKIYNWGIKWLLSLVYINTRDLCIKKVTLSVTAIKLLLEDKLLNFLEWKISFQRFCTVLRGALGHILTSCSCELLETRPGIKISWQ